MIGMANWRASGIKREKNNGRVDTIVRAEKNILRSACVFVSSADPKMSRKYEILCWPEFEADFQAIFSERSAPTFESCRETKVWAGGIDAEDYLEM